MKNFAKSTVAAGLCLLIPGLACADDQPFAADSH